MVENLRERKDEFKDGSFFSLNSTFLPRNKSLNNTRYLTAPHRSVLRLCRLVVSGGTAFLHLLFRFYN